MCLLLCVNIVPSGGGENRVEKKRQVEVRAAGILRPKAGEVKVQL